MTKVNLNKLAEFEAALNHYRDAVAQSVVMTGSANRMKPVERKRQRLIQLFKEAYRHGEGRSTPYLMEEYKVNAN